MDKFLWKVVDFSEIPIEQTGGNYIIKNFCSGFTREISLRALSKDGDRPDHEWRLRRFDDLQDFDEPRTRSKWYRYSYSPRSMHRVICMWLKLLVDRFAIRKN